ncbi:energy transducer TonB|uniref:Outer membrane transport energization protein TonB n=1 Tax=Dendrosporobacter quercicolus TaxID=146817 RepID=A0A1G9U019_9FIRM|nr:energy transducer TonB [Dendrosporobacter quercicolus]NSL48801.1 energy transducer TonB [Dendrosporobacter quercicolus DSM 1736]SDM53153.1 outer membrane transport energization protein TonB [Dendrosporobacter quercicolus]
MSYTNQWRKAMSVSVFLHFLVFAAAGFLSIGLTAPALPAEEVIMEMDLVSDPLADRAGPTPEPAPPQAPEPAPIEPAPTEPQPPASQPVPEPVVASDEIAPTQAAPVAAPAPKPAPSPAPRGGGGRKSAPAAAASGGGGGGSQSGIAAPGVLSKVEPSYPPAARKAGHEGVAVLRVKVLSNGRPDEVSVTSSSGSPLLDDAAVSAVRKWRFIPAKDRRSGKTVPAFIRLPVSFKLRSS